MAVVGPLAVSAEPHTYDLCEAHAMRLTAPKGWDLLRHDMDYSAQPPSPDDLEALADAVREAGRPGQREDPQQVGRRGHLRALPSPG
jgi:hypothetical protein